MGNPRQERRRENKLADEEEEETFSPETDLCSVLRNNAIVPPQAMAR